MQCMFEEEKCRSVLLILVHKLQVVEYSSLDDLLLTSRSATVVQPMKLDVTEPQTSRSDASVFVPR